MAEQASPPDDEERQRAKRAAVESLLRKAQGIPEQPLSERSMEEVIKSLFPEPTEEQRLKFEAEIRKRDEEDKRIKAFKETLPEKFSRLPYSIIANSAWNNMKLAADRDLVAEKPALQKESLPEDAILLGPYSFFIGSDKPGEEIIYLIGTLASPGPARRIGVHIPLPPERMDFFIRAHEQGKFSLDETGEAKYSSARSTHSRMLDTFEKAVGLTPMPTLKKMMFWKKEDFFLIRDSRDLPRC
jgi:hypothetical protein